MASLTFSRPPPLQPVPSNTPDKSAGREPLSQHSPLNSPTSTETPHSIANPAPISATATAGATTSRGVPLYPESNRTRPGPGDTPYNTPAAPLASSPMTITSRPSIAHSAVVPSSLSTPLGSVRPINTVSAMRGRGIGIGGPGGAGKRGDDLPPAFTPGNTPSSLERISRRMQSNLMLGNGNKGEVGGGAAGQSGMYRIAPSYERRFNAGLNDIDHRLTAHAESGLRSPPQTISPSLSDKAPYLGDRMTSRSDWASQFGDTSESDDSQGKKE